ncbi:hypothetical protein TNCV_3069831 [Trichonephila clavipes]|nr:hypothetical protein TNCV_3069831 [Trichonephila clavipes]
MLQKTIYRPISKETGAPQLSRLQISLLLPQGKQISRKNCCQTFWGGGLYARRPVVCVPLTRQHRLLDSEGIQRLVWPARSPDLNPIENVWDALGRQVAGRNYPPTNKNTYPCTHRGMG